MNIREVNTAIMQGTWTNDELTSMIDAVKYARSRVANQVRFTVRMGQNVEFTSSKTGRRVQGTVEKIAIKYATVKTVDGRWKVPMNMLTLT